MTRERQGRKEFHSNKPELMIFDRFAAWAGIASACVLLCRGDEVATSLPSDTPKVFNPRTNTFDYVRREEMVAMRDGVKLKTFIVVPKGATNAPMLLSRTPYGASKRVSRS